MGPCASLCSASPLRLLSSHLHQRRGSLPARPSLLHPSRNSYSPDVIGLLQRAQAPGLNQRHSTSRISRTLRISTRTRPTDFRSAGGEQPIAGIPLPSPHRPLGSISPPSIHERPPISSRSARNTYCSVQSPQGN